jgi:choline dehydrogenase-like flavoprotein
LEAGPEKPAAKSQTLFEGAHAIGHPLPGLHLGRFRNLGGTTAFWGGQLVPFSSQVFTDRPWVGGASWPINEADLAPHFTEAFEILGLSRVLRDDAEVWRRLKVAPPPATAEIQPIFTRWVPEPNLAIHFAAEIRSNPHLIVIVDAQVAAFDVADNGEIGSAEIVLPDLSRRRIYGRRFVLANGTIEITRLLLMPAAGGMPAPWATNAWIGRGFIDHVDCVAGTVQPIDQRRFSDIFDNAFLDGIKYNPKLRLADEVQSREQLLEISGHFIFKSSISESISNLKILLKGLMRGKVSRRELGNPLALLGTLRFVVPMILRYLRYRRMLNFSDGGIQLRLTSEQRPLPDSRITLRESRDVFGMPEVDVDWRIDSRDLETVRRFALMLKDYLETNRIAEVKVDPRLAAGDPAFLAEIDDANHQMGGARMASGVEEGVVDHNCQVFGSRNLYVAGQAVYPTSGFGNPTFTAIGLGQRLAAHFVALDRNGS